MLKAIAQDRLAVFGRLLVGFLAGFSIVDAIGAGAILAPMLLPFLYWAVVTANTTVARVVLAALAGVCLALGISVALFFAGLRSDIWFWIALAIGACAFVALFMLAASRVGLPHEKS